MSRPHRLFLLLMAAVATPTLAAAEAHAHTCDHPAPGVALLAPFDDITGAVATDLEPFRLRRKTKT